MLPWSTHNRFIISYQTLRRPEYFDPLIQHLSARLKKSLLVLDEAYTAAPASSSKYAIDSRITRVVRDLAPRFENRLFLSATPHNGHSNSFSALMELLDPQRFTRGVSIDGQSGALHQVMVRRLKKDLRSANLGSFPIRKVVRIDIEGSHEELRLAAMLSEYTQLMKPKKGRGQLVFTNLQKRLLSSVDAFYRTLEVHAERAEAGLTAKEAELSLSEPPAPSGPPSDPASHRADSDRAPDEPRAETVEPITAARDAETYDADEDLLDREEDAVVRDASGLLQSPQARAKELLNEMLDLARKLRSRPDAKTLALIDWIREHQCPAACAPIPEGGTSEQETEATKEQKQWTHKRVIIFTEYADTKRYLQRQLDNAVEGTELDELRIQGFHGAMSDEQREQVQRHFNGDPQEFPVRILVATDAAREGLNLQNHCADLFHFDIPWNPARMEQRNGRIDRTLQPEPEVRCHYFAYAERKEDVVLDKVVGKVDTIQEELGSLGDVVLRRIEGTLSKGIDESTAASLEHTHPDDQAQKSVQAELETTRSDVAALQKDTDVAAKSSTAPPS